MSERYALLVDLTGRPCLAVGGGAVAARKIRGLLDAGADVTVIAPELAAPVAELAESGRVAHLAGTYGGEAAEGSWWFVVAATDDRTVNARVAADATGAGTWANDASDPAGGPAALPAVHRDGPVTLAVSTGGTHPRAALWLRDLAADAIGPEHVTLVELVAEVQATGPAGGTTGRLDWRADAVSGMLELIREGRAPEAKERLQACLSSSSD